MIGFTCLLIATQAHQLAYVHRHVLYVVACDASGYWKTGKGPIRICQVPPDPVNGDKTMMWSPSGQIAFYSPDSASAYPASIDLSDVRKGASPRPVVMGTDPQFSPDGTQMAFVAARERTSTSWTADTWLLNFKTGRKSAFARDAGVFVWSRTGRQIAYAKQAEGFTDIVSVCDYPGLAVRRTDEGVNACQISFSPDGRMLAVHHHMSRPLTGHDIIEIASGAAIHLSYPEGTYAPPILEDWSPDSRGGVFAWRIQDPMNDGSWVREYEAIMQFDTGKNWIIAEGNGARFSPNGKAILYRTGNPYQSGDLCWRSIDRKGRAVRLLRGVSQFALR